MRVVASEEAVELIRARGGSLYVSVRSTRCCGGRHLSLGASTEPQPGREFVRVPAPGLELYLQADFGRLPDELHVTARRGRVQAFWDGCAWIV